MTESKRPLSVHPPRAPEPRADYRVPSAPPFPSPKKPTKVPLPPRSSGHPAVQAYRNKLQSISENEGLAISFLDPELEELLNEHVPPQLPPPQVEEVEAEPETEKKPETKEPHE